MDMNVRIPQGDDTIKIELTMKEAMALAGIKFHNNHKIEISAKKKLNHMIEEHYIEERKPVN